MRTLSLATLKGSKIGIDANNYIDSVIRANGEPLIQALGGFPYTLLEHIAMDLAAFKNHGITPFFVFDGLSVNSQQPVTSDSTKRETSIPPAGSTNSSSNIVSETANILHKRTQAWDDYEKGQAEQAVRGFDQISDLSFDVRKQNGVRTLFNFFNSQDPAVEFVVAPYTATAQLVYFLSEGYVDGVYGSLDVLLSASTDRLITHIDSRGNGGHGNFSWLSKRQFLHDLALTHEQFLEACIISGSLGFSPYSSLLYPPISQQLLSTVAGGPAAAAAAISAAGSAVAAGLYQASAPFKVALDYVLASPTSIFTTIAAYSQQQEAGIPTGRDKYVIKFQKAYATILYQPVLKENGKVEPIPPESEWPSDVHDFVGQRLPDEIYFYLAHGLVGPELLNGLTSGYLFEPASLDGGRAVSYRRFITNIQDEVQSKALSFLSQTLHRYFQHKPIKTVLWYELTRDHVVRRMQSPLFYQTHGWKVTQDILEGPYAKEKIARYKSKLAKLICPFYVTEGDSEDDVQTFMNATIYKKKPSTVSTPPIASPTPPPGSTSSASGSSTGGSSTPVGGIPGVTTSYPPPAPPVLSSVKELISNGFWRVLQASGIFNAEHHLTPWGKVAAKALNILETDPDYKKFAVELSEPLLLAILLLRDGFLNSSKLDPEYTGGPDTSVSADAQAHILLLSRISAYVPLRQHPVGYAGPLSRTVLAFGSIISRQYSAYRQIVEAANIAILANGEVDRIHLLPNTPVPSSGAQVTSAQTLNSSTSSSSVETAVEPSSGTGSGENSGDSSASSLSSNSTISEPSIKVWNHISKHLPFVQPPNCGTGIAMKLYLDKAATGGPINTPGAAILSSEANGNDLSLAAAAGINIPSAPSSAKLEKDSASSSSSGSDKSNSATSQSGDNNNNNNNSNFDKKRAISDLKRMFKQTIDIVEDMDKAFTLWKVVYQGVVEAEAQGLLTTSATRSFHTTNTWVKPYII